MLAPVTRAARRGAPPLLGTARFRRSAHVCGYMAGYKTAFSTLPARQTIDFQPVDSRHAAVVQSVSHFLKKEIQLWQALKTAS